MPIQHVTDEQFANSAALDRHLKKTATLLHSFDPSFPADLASRTRVVCREGYFGPGYGRSDDTTDEAVRVAQESLGLTLDTTYSGKTMAALLADLAAGIDGPLLFWNTYNSRPFEVDETMPIDTARMPEEFSRYFDAG